MHLNTLRMRGSVSECAHDWRCRMGLPALESSPQSLRDPPDFHFSTVNGRDILIFRQAQGRGRMRAAAWRAGVTSTYDEGVAHAEVPTSSACCWTGSSTVLDAHVFQNGERLDHEVALAPQTIPSTQYRLTQILSALAAFSGCVSRSHP